MLKSAWLVPAVFLVFASTPNPGVIFEVELTDHGGETPHVQNIQIKVDGLNLTIPFQASEGSGQSGAMIFRGDRGEHGEMIIIMHDQRSYMVMDDSIIEQLGNTVSEVERMMEEQIKNLPPEQQEAIRKARESGMGGMGISAAPAEQPEVEVKKTDDHATKAGYPCVKYEVFSDGEKTRELWVTDWDNIEGGAEAKEAFKRMSAFFEHMMAAMPNAPGAKQLGPFGQAKFDEGFPVVTRGFDEEGNLADESTLKSASRQTIDPDEFEPPSGYKRMSMGR